jgi:hypothetical protein
MSTNAVIIDPTGQARQVPSDKVDMYVKLGAKPARTVVDPQGQARYVSEDRYMDALGAGGSPYHPPSPAPALPEAGPVSRFLTAAGANLPTPSGLLNMLRVGGNPTGLGPTGGVVQGFADDAANNSAVQMATSPQPLNTDVKQAAGLAGFNGSSIAADARNGDYAGLAGDVLSPAAQLLAGVRLASKLKSPTPNVPGQNYTPAQGSAFTGYVSRGAGLGKNFDPYATTTSALSDIRSAAANHPEVADVVANGTAQQHVGGSQFLVDKAIGALEDYHNPIRQSVGSAPAFDNVANSTAMQRLAELRNSYPQSATAERGFVQSLMDDIGKAKDLNDLNKYRKLFNDYAAPSYDKTSVAQGQAPNAQQAYRTAADAVRQDYYGRLQQLTGVDMRPTMSRESALMDVKQSLGSQGSQLLQKNAVATEPKPLLRDAIDRVSKEGITRGAASFVKDRMFGETPLSQPQYLAKRFLSNLPEPSNGLTFVSPSYQSAVPKGSAIQRYESPMPPAESGAALESPGTLALRNALTRRRQ